MRVDQAVVEESKVSVQKLQIELTKLLTDIDSQKVELLKKYRDMYAILENDYPSNKPTAKDDGKPRIIYLITNLINKKMYVGQTCKTIVARWNDHVRDSRRSIARFYLQEAIQKYGSDNFSIIEIGSALNKRTADDLERLYISFLHTHDPQIGYNLTRGGSGVVPAAKAAQKRRDTMTTRVHPMLGKKHTPEARLKMSLARKGKSHSPVHRENLAKVNRQRWDELPLEDKIKFNPKIKGVQ